MMTIRRQRSALAVVSAALTVLAGASIAPLCAGAAEEAPATRSERPINIHIIGFDVDEAAARLADRSDVVISARTPASRGGSWRTRPTSAVRGRLKTGWRGLASMSPWRRGSPGSGANASASAISTRRPSMSMGGKAARTKEFCWCDERANSCIGCGKRTLNHEGLELHCGAGVPPAWRR